MPKCREISRFGSARRRERKWGTGKGLFSGGLDCILWFRNQPSYRITHRIPGIARSSATVTEVSGPSCDAADLRSSMNAIERSVGGDNRVHPIFQPSIDDAHRFQCALNSERFSPVERPSHRECAVLDARTPHRRRDVSLTTGNVLDMYKSIAWELGLPSAAISASVSSFFMYLPRLALTHSIPVRASFAPSAPCVAALRADGVRDFGLQPPSLGSTAHKCAIA